MQMETPLSSESKLVHFHPEATKCPKLCAPVTFRLGEEFLIFSVLLRTTRNIPPLLSFLSVPLPLVFPVMSLEKCKALTASGKFSTALPRCLFILATSSFSIFPHPNVQMSPDKHVTVLRDFSSSLPSAVHTTQACPMPRQAEWFALHQ